MIKRMDNVLIVVEDLEAAKAFFAELGMELEGETTVEGRRRMLVRTLVDEGLADMARFVEISDGQPTDGRAIAAHSPEQEALLRLASERPRGSVEDELALLDEIARAMRDASICGLGQTAANAVESAIRNLGVFEPQGAA